MTVGRYYRSQFRDSSVTFCTKFWTSKKTLFHVCTQSTILESKRGAESTTQQHQALFGTPKIEEALIAIATQTSVKVNLCLFIDALDEHGGNHRDLLRILNRLVDSTNNKLFRLRLCLASRPQNVFR